jgi:hypothetical protein
MALFHWVAGNLQTGLMASVATIVVWSEVEICISLSMMLLEPPFATGSVIRPMGRQTP